MASFDGKRLPVAAASTVFRRLPEGAVLFSTESEVYFGVGDVGADIWEQLPPASETLDELVAKLAARYHDVPAEQIRTDVEEFIAELLQNGLVTPHPANAGDRPAKQGESAPG